jgi:putative transposase
MTSGLHRYQQCGDLHFITFSCYQRLANFRDPAACELFENAFEDVRRRYRLAVLGYVVMPEHVHLLVNEPGRGRLDQLVQALKICGKKAPRAPVLAGPLLRLQCLFGEKDD